MVMPQAMIHRKGIHHRVCVCVCVCACVCVRVCVCVYNDVIPSVLRLSGADRQGLWRSSVFISTGRVMDCRGGGVAAP